MVAVPANQVRRPTSFVEAVVARVALWRKVRAAKRGDRPSVLRRLVLWVADVFGTVAMMAAFTFAAFTYVGGLAGFIVLGVSFPVVEFKLFMARWKQTKP